MTSKVEYLGVIIEDGVNYKLFRCVGKNVEDDKKHDILYFKHSKDTRNSEIIHFRDYMTKKESQIRKLLRSRIACPRFERHSKKIRNHKYIFVRSYGNSKRQYCICHEKNKKNRYEFIVDNKKTISIKEFLETHVYELYEKLLDISENVKADKSYDFVCKEYKILELLFKIGFPDKIIAKFLGTNQTKINRIKLKNNFKHVMRIRTVDFSHSNVFEWKIRDISYYKIKTFHNLIEEYGFKITSKIKTADAKDTYGEC